MLIKIIEENAERKCIESLEELLVSSVNRNVLQCRFSCIGLTPKPDDILPLVKDIFADKQASLFFCQDGDIFVFWSGYPKATLNNIIDCILRKYSGNIPENKSEMFFKYYDCHAHGEDIRIECRNKLKKIREYEEKKQAESERANSLEEVVTDFDGQMLNALKGNLVNRRDRGVIEILIVEDQLFSRKLLMATLSQKYKCHVAENASEAIVLYALHAPDIVLLDIELPDMDGHSLAELFNKVDPNAYIIMVTGNHYVDDIEKAKRNKVKGFIVKPYNKQKIADSINKFRTLKEKGI